MVRYFQWAGLAGLAGCILLGSIIFPSSITGAQQKVANDKDSTTLWRLTRHPGGASLRGVDVHGDFVWASGSKGTVLLSTDRGASWNEVGPEGAGELDFRDIEVLDDNTAIAMAVGSPARIYRTEDRGRSWQLVFEDERPEIFLDAMAFWDEFEGIAFGDPIDGKIVVLKTNDGGQSWSELSDDQKPDALAGEGGFAASGTCLTLLGDEVWIGLGGAREEANKTNARFLHSTDRGGSWTSIESPLGSGAASGIFSIAFANNERGVAVGGTYNEPQDASNHCCLTRDGGQTWTRPPSTPRGYRSCVIGWYSENPRFLAIGKTGVDFSQDGGEHWQAVGELGFYAAEISDDQSIVVAVGSEGRIGVLTIDQLPLD